MQDVFSIQFKQIFFDTNDYTKMVHLRTEVLRKPLGLIFSADDLEKDKSDFLIAGFLHETLVCCCILTDLKNDNFKLRQMAVVADLQGKKIGQNLLVFAEKLAKEKNIKCIELNARLHAKEFYEKCGYKSNGEEFLEVLIPHVKMIKHF